MSPRYDELGQRVTDCCGCFSTYVEDPADPSLPILVCKSCYKAVPLGQGDGTEFRAGVTSDAYFTQYFQREADRRNRSFSTSRPFSSRSKKSHLCEWCRRNPTEFEDEDMCSWCKEELNRREET